MSENEKRIIRLKGIHAEMDKLSEEKAAIEAALPELFCFQNPDKTWTRFSKIDTIQELQEKGLIYRACVIKPFACKVETLKNRPRNWGVQPIERKCDS